MKFSFRSRNNDILTKELLSTGKVLVLPGPRNKFTELEVNAVRAFLNDGGNVLVMLGEGGEKQSNTNVNFLLEEFGIMVNNGTIHNIINIIIYIPENFQFAYYFHHIFRQRYTYELQSNAASKGMPNCSRNIE